MKNNSISMQQQIIMNTQIEYMIARNTKCKFNNCNEQHKVHVYELMQSCILLDAINGLLFHEFYLNFI